MVQGWQIVVKDPTVLIGPTVAKVVRDLAEISGAGFVVVDGVEGAGETLEDLHARRPVVFPVEQLVALATSMHQFEWGDFHFLGTQDEAAALIAVDSIERRVIGSRLSLRCVDNTCFFIYGTDLDLREAVRRRVEVFEEREAPVENLDFPGGDGAAAEGSGSHPERTAGRADRSSILMRIWSRIATRGRSPMNGAEIRRASCERALTLLGVPIATDLPPIPHGLKIRPKASLVRRVAALGIVARGVCDLTPDQVRAALEREDLTGELADDESALIGVESWDCDLLPFAERIHVLLWALSIAPSIHHGRRCLLTLPPLLPDPARSESVNPLMRRAALRSARVILEEYDLLLGLKDALERGVRPPREDPLYELFIASRFETMRWVVGLEELGGSPATAAGPRGRRTK